MTVSFTLVFFFVILLLNCNVFYFIMFILVVLVNHSICSICNTFRYLFFSVGKK